MNPLIVTSCGTSLLTNTATDSTQRKRLLELANASKLTGEDQAFLERCLAQARERLFSGAEDPRRLSAELNGLLTFFEGRVPRQAVQLLVATDTAQGRGVAQLISDWLAARFGCAANIQAPPDLALRSAEALRWGLASLAHELEQQCKGYQQIFFNLSGGFKSINGFLQALGMLYGAEIFYIFERGTELVRIPRLPLRIDAELFRTHLLLFRKLANGLGEAAATLRQAGIPESLWLEDEGDVCLSEWGEALWLAVKAELYKSELLPPLPPLCLQAGLEAHVQTRLKEHLAIINERLDQLAQHLSQRRSGHARSLQGLDFKKLRGDPRPPATHEFDITHSHGALRGFGYFDGEGFMVTAIDWHD